jgi:hypothetical protein
MLSANEELLSRTGWAYLGWPMRRSARIDSKIESLHRKGLNVIISDEGLWHHCGTPRSDTSAIADVLASYDVTVLVYLRRPDHYVESWYSQGMKTGSGATSLRSFLSSGHVNSRRYAAPPRERDARGAVISEGLLANLDLSILAKLEFFESNFPGARIVVRPFERSQLAEGDILSDFLVSVDLPPDLSERMERPEPVNVSPSADAVLFCGIMREVYEVPDDLIEVFLRTASGSGPTDRTRILRYEEAVAINDAMRPVFEIVQERWGGGIDPTFFRDWEIDAGSFDTSPLRDAHDRLVGDALSAR